MSSLHRLLEIMARLRDPESGCPWDREQDFGSIAPYTIEEAYEVADAIDRDNMKDLKDELGDLLFQVVYHAQLATEKGSFSFDDVVENITDKIVRRHPHVFSDAQITSSREQSGHWEAIKREERASSKSGGQHSHLDGIPLSLPAMMHAQKLQTRAASAGFDWQNAHAVLEKVGEELEELHAELARDENHKRVSEELGDLFFSCINLARHLQLDAERCLREANAKFSRRFRLMEEALAREGKHMDELDQETLDKLWERAKKAQ